jgi:hypothetical protein
VIAFIKLFSTIQQVRQKIWRRIDQGQGEDEGVDSSQEDDDDYFDDDEEENNDGLSFDDLRKLVLILNFINVDFILCHLHTLELFNFPEYQWYDCCMDCCNTNEHEEWEKYTDSIEGWVENILSLLKWKIFELEPAEEISPVLREYIANKATHFFHNYRDFDCAVFDPKNKKLECINFIDERQTQFRLLSSVLMSICQDV